MKVLIIFSALFSFQVKADAVQALSYLASQGWARDHYDAYQFHYTNKPTPEEQTIRSYENLSRDNAIMNQGFNQPSNTRNCVYDQSTNSNICN